MLGSFFCQIEIFQVQFEYGRCCTPFGVVSEARVRLLAPGATWLLLYL